MKNNNDVAEEWYRFAMMDFTTAKYICNMRPKPLEIICYHLQQSAEKLLKGFIVSNNAEAPKTHDLTLLCEMCMEINADFETLKENCKNLTPYGSQPRYPDEMEISELDTEKALQDIKSMIKFFKRKDIELKELTNEESE